MASITTVFRTDKVNKKNEAPIHFRIIKDRKISYIASGVMLPIENWDEKNSRVKAKHPNSARINSMLSNKFTELQDQVMEFETINKSLTSRGLRDKVYGKKPFDFFPFADEVVEQYLVDKQISTYDKNRSILAKFKEFAKGNNLCFQDITPEYLTKYDRYLKETKNNKINTIYKDFKFLRKIFNDAYRKDIIEHSVNPFNKYKMKTEKTERSYFTEEELKKFERVELPINSKLELSQDMFIFSSYAGGLRVSDMLQLQWKHFDGENINFTVKKTNTQLSIRVPNKGLEIIEKYRKNKKDSNSFIFPALKANTNLDDEREVDTAISRSTALINKNLKVIAQRAFIEKPISFHISRHTWATRALRKGISIDKVSKLMGHAAIRETQIYAKIVNSELDKAMDVFND